MADPSSEVIRYRRNHFSTRLPAGYRYTRSHFWLRHDEPECSKGETASWRIGLTGFAARMLGEIVEFEFEVGSGDPVRVAQTIGWIEGFKAVSDLISIAEGSFAESNRAAVEDPELICTRPYDDGWLYRVLGSPDVASMDVDGYVSFLDATIDKMLEKPWRSPTDFAADPES